MMNTTKNLLFRYQTVFYCLLLVFSACNHIKEREPEIKSDMRDSYGAAYALYRDIWSKERFADPRNRDEINFLLDRLVKNFHNVQEKARGESLSKDSGYTTTLLINRDILLDAKRRFNEGNLDYAAWQLRGLMHSCIACHTRHKAPVKFVGEVPMPSSASKEDLLEHANFLVATRQFDRANTELIKLVTTPGPINSSEQLEFRALKLWLVVQLKDKPNFLGTISELQKLAILDRFRGETKTILDSWIRDLKKFERENKSRNSVVEAKELLDFGSDEVSYLKDDESLVSTLYATSILQSLLQTAEGDARRQVVCLLGEAYHHIFIEQLEVFRGTYLEQCIKEFPGTKDAQRAFMLFEKEFEFLASPVNGVQLEAEDRSKLESLKKIAFSPQ